MLLKKKLYVFAFVLSFFATVTSCSSDDGNPEPQAIAGCTDPAALNYNPDATESDGSCQYPDPDPNGFQGVVDYVKTFGGSDIDEANDVVQANDGNYVIIGSTKSVDGDITDKSDPSLDFWVLKVDPQGNVIWSKTYGGANDDEGFSINKTDDGGYILSGYSRSSGGDNCGGSGDVCENGGFQDFWIAKIDGSGTLQWETSHGFLGGEQCLGAIQTNDGGYFAVGFLDLQGSGGAGEDFNGSSSRGSLHGLGEYWGIKLDANGNKEWRRFYGGTNNDRAYDVLQTPDNGYIMAGAAESNDFDITDDKGSYDYWVTKISETGELQWAKSYGGSEIDNCFSIAPTEDGNYIIVGDTRSNDQDVSTAKGNADLWGVKLSGNNGNIIWEKSFGGTQFESARGIEPMANNKYVVSGSSRSADGDVAENNGQNDAWVIVLNDQGVIQFETNIGGSDLDFGNAAIETTDNKLILVGETDSNDGDITLNKGIKDLLLVKVK